jgi:hypothetical protein
MIRRFQIKDFSLMNKIHVQKSSKVFANERLNGPFVFIWCG